MQFHGSRNNNYFQTYLKVKQMLKSSFLAAQKVRCSTYQSERVKAVKVDMSNYPLADCHVCIPVSLTNLQMVPDFFNLFF